MPKYMFTVSYTLDGVKGLLDVGGSNRAAAVDELVGSVDGNVEGFYYAFGESDAYIIADVPDHAAATALSLRVAAGGTATVKTTVLLDPTEIDEAAQRDVTYRPAKGLF